MDLGLPHGHKVTILFYGSKLEYPKNELPNVPTLHCKHIQNDLQNLPSPGLWYSIFVAILGGSVVTVVVSCSWPTISTYHWPPIPSKTQISP